MSTVGVQEMTHTDPMLGLNRFDFHSPRAFSLDVVRAEAAGWDWAYIPASSLRLRDPYINLAFAAEVTQRIGLGVLLDSPIARDAGVLASSIATVDELAPGRTQLTLGVGDTAVRLLGNRPARVAELERATKLCRSLLTGQETEVGAARPARLQHPRDVPVWIAAGGPRTLRMAGAVADGVWLRVGCHEANLRGAYQMVCEGADEAGRDPAEVALGLIFHVVWDTDRVRAETTALSMAAGYYEFSPTLFEGAGIEWNGPPIEELKTRVWPDFHHHHDLLESGDLVRFLDPLAMDAFALYGDAGRIADRLADILSLGLPVKTVVAHPMPAPAAAASRPGYIERFPTEIWSQALSLMRTKS